MIPPIYRVRLRFDVRVPPDGTRDLHDEKTYDCRTCFTVDEVRADLAKKRRDPPFKPNAKLIGAEVIVSYDVGYTWKEYEGG